jgi:hypothetical protein
MRHAIDVEVEYGDREKGRVEILYFLSNVDSQEKPTAIVFYCIVYCTLQRALQRCTHPSVGALLSIVELKSRLRYEFGPTVRRRSIRPAWQGRPGGHPPVLARQPEGIAVGKQSSRINTTRPPRAFFHHFAQHHQQSGNRPCKTVPRYHDRIYAENRISRAAQQRTHA